MSVYLASPVVLSHLVIWFKDVNFRVWTCTYLQ